MQARFLPLTTYFICSAGVALRRREKYANGTPSVRPSTKSTHMVSSSNLTCFARASSRPPSYLTITGKSRSFRLSGEKNTKERKQEFGNNESHRSREYSCHSCRSLLKKRGSFRGALLGDLREFRGHFTFFSPQLTWRPGLPVPEK
jgi:hypothetical protein